MLSTDQEYVGTVRNAIQHNSSINQDSNDYIRQYCYKSVYVHQGQESDTVSSWRHGIAL